MIRFLTLILVMFSVFSIDGPAQDCGIGQRTIKFFVPNGSQLEKPQYELISVSPREEKTSNSGGVARFLSKTFFPNFEVRLSNFWTNESHVIPNEIAENFLKTYKASNFRDDPDFGLHHKNNLAGEIKLGGLKFSTGEVYDFPYLLKITSANMKTVYLLGSHLGGCSRQDKVVIDYYEAEVISL